jgi:hypothetical protein
MHMLYAVVVAALVVIRSSNRQHTIEPKHNASSCKYTYTKLGETLLGEMGADLLSQCIS